MLFSSTDQNVVEVLPPVNDSIYPYSALVIGRSEGSATIYAHVWLRPDDGNYDCLGTASVNVNNFSWFQTQEGDVHSGGSIRSRVPVGQNFSLDRSGGFPGVISYTGLGADFTPGGISSKNWLANSGAKRNSYSFFYQLLGSPALEPPPTGGTISNSDLPKGDGGVKAYNGDIQTGDAWQIGRSRIVILTSGKFTISHKISIANEGSLVVVAKQGIDVAWNFGGSNNQVQGIFITDGTFNSSVGGSANNQLIVEGGVIAQSVNLGRDLGANNGTTPAEKFVYRPDLWLNIYPQLWKRSHLWEEVAP
ncbi:MAG: hypothetical protein ACPL4K_05410 [Candidatus Margulisiibacteriota bacterium]